MSQIRELAEKIFRVNANNGFWDDRLGIPEKLKNGVRLTDEEIEHVEMALKNQALLLVITELAEMVDASRKTVDYGYKIEQYKNHLEATGKDFDKEMFEKMVKDSPQDEFADTQIRMLDIERGYRMDVEWHMDQKLKYNASRKPKHGKRY
jgi:SAM-dependent MidA family methyltransferase